MIRNFNPRPPCGGRPALICVPAATADISIHAPRVGGDKKIPEDWANLLIFQSTPPVWGATFVMGLALKKDAFQSTPPVWGATYLQFVRG